MRKHLRFSNFPEQLVALVSDFLSTKPWEAQREGRDVSEAVSVLYAAAAPLLDFDGTVRFEIDSGSYFERLSDYDISRQVEHTSMDYLHSVVVYMGGYHSIGVFAALADACVVQVGDRDFTDWACSLVYTARPGLFRSMARSGRVHGVTARDTYTTASWDRLCQAGLAAGEHLLYSPNEAYRFLQTDELPEDLASVSDDEDEEDAPMVQEADPEIDRLLEEEEEIERSFRQSEASTDLSHLSIVVLRKVSRGAVAGGYSMQKDALIEAIRSSLSEEEIARRVAEAQA